MRYPASEKLEIIRLVEGSHLPAKHTLDKLGLDINPAEVVRNGNRQMHAVEAVKTGDHRLTPLDSALFLVGDQPFLPHVTECPDRTGGSRFVLWSNKWGTNFSMWCAADLIFRFRIELR